MRGLWSGPSTTLKGQCLMSAWTVGSVYFRPMRRFASKTVFWGFMATFTHRETLHHKGQHPLSVNFPLYDFIVHGIGAISCKEQIYFSAFARHSMEVVQIDIYHSFVNRANVGHMCHSAVNLTFEKLKLSLKVLQKDTWFFAASPTSRSVSVKATYDGVTRLP